MRQQIYDVLPGRPFGRGTAISSISSDPNTRTYGTSSGANVYLGSAILANGDLALIHQSYGGGATEENWELFVVASGGSTTTVVAESALGRTYSAGAQIIKVPEYLNLTITSGFAGKSYGATVANSSKNAIGGINVISVRNLLTLQGVIHQNGYQGFYATSDRGGIDEWNFFKWWYDNAPSGGFIGGANSTDGGTSANGGGYAYGYRGAENRNPEDNGGGGAYQDRCAAGGGNVSAGGNGEDGSTGGVACGNAALTSMYFGGGGGGANGGAADPRWTGGSGGGIWIIYCREIAFTGSGGIQCIGGTGFGNKGHASGAGAGGCILVNCQTGAFGTNLLVATPGTYYDHATSPSTGRIRINYGSTITGTTNPAASTNNDKLLNPLAGGAVLAALI